MTPEGLARLEQDEGYKQFVYDDYNGHQITKGSHVIGNPTIGFGRNLSARGLTKPEALAWLNADLEQMWAHMSALVPWLIDLPPIWRDAVLMIEYNTGNVFQFKMMLLALKAGEYGQALLQLRMSHADRELPARYGRIIEACSVGHW